MSRLTGAEALTRLLKAEGVPYVFGVAGGKLSPFLHAISQEPSIRWVGVRHEAAGPLMAAAIAAGSGQICVAVGEMGPGSSNLVGGLGSSFNNNLPVLLITSNNHHAAAYPNRGMFMDLNTHDLFRPLTKWNAVVHHGARLPELVQEAFRQALTGRPGPVHLDIPQEILAGSHDYDEALFEIPPASYRTMERPRAARQSVEDAAALLAGASRPVLLAGGGVVASNGGAVFRDLMNLVKAPATATQMGIGVVPSSSPYFIGHGGIIGGDAITMALKEADVILAVGCRFSSWLWDENGALTNNGAKLININIDPAGMGGNARHSVAIWADATSAMTDLIDALGNRPMPERSGWLEKVRQVHDSYRLKLQTRDEEGNDVMHPGRLAEAIGAALPEDAIVAYDGGHTTFWSNDLTPTERERTRFHEPGMCQLGFGTPYAIALKLLHPNKPVFNITGDGAFGFTLSELDTARRYRLPVINIIHNNSAWGVIKYGQRKGLDFELGVDLDGTQYDAIARGFGCHGERVTTIEELGPAIERSMASGLPAVIDCRVRFEPHPSMPYFGKMNAYGFPGGHGGPHTRPAGENVN